MTTCIEQGYSACTGNGRDGKKDGRALTPRPPLGWNSYDCYGCSANQRVVRANLDAFAKKLKPAGYEYFVIDNGWFAEYAVAPGEEFTREREAADIRLDSHGRQLPSNVSFPDGLKPLIDHWLTPHQTIEGAGWFGLFNRTESPWQGEVDLQQIGIDPHAELWDIWCDCPVNSDNGIMTAELAADDVLFVRYEG